MSSRRPVITNASSRSHRKWAFALSMPAALLFAVLVIAPSAAVIVLSFMDYRLGEDPAKFVGFLNYQALAKDPLFWKALVNTCIYVAVVVPLSVVVGLAAAVLIESRTRFKSFYRIAFFLPTTATLVAMASVWELLLLPGIGLINQVLGAFGLQSVAFLSNPDTALYTLCAIGVWQLAGFNMVVFMAGLTAIPKYLYEAIELDGAGHWEKFRNVTLPLLGPTFMFALSISTIAAFRVFDIVTALTQGKPEDSTEVLLHLMYLEGFRYFNIGHASALTIVFLVLTIGLVLFQTHVVDRRVHY